MSLTNILKGESKKPQRIVKMFNFYDSKAEAFAHAPQFYETTGLAIRAIQKGCNTKGSGFAENPADYTFFEVGTYNLDTGEVKMYDTKKELGLALQFVENSSLTNSPVM